MHVIVVGGGIVGLASAYYLRERGVDVTVCEKGSLGSGSTERSAGGIRTQFSTPVNVDLSLASIEVWESFDEAFDTEIEYRRSGYLFLAREEATAETFREQVRMQNERGAPSEFLSPAAAREQCPGLRTDRFEGATYCGIDGFADPHLALQGFSAAATEAGVDVRTKTAVTDVVTEDGTVVGVEADGKRIDADFVVNAAGPWAARVADLAGVEIPVAPRRRQIAVVAPEDSIPESVPLTIDLDTGSYFRPEREGQALVGGHFDDGDPDQDPDAYGKKMDTDWAVTAVERASDTATYFGPETRIKRGWAGLYAVTPDHHPIVEESVPGFVQAVGFSGHGFQHAPATGQVVAELCLDGQPPVDVSVLSSDRFEEGSGIEELNVA